MTDKIHGFIKVHSSDLVVPTLTVRSRSAGGMMGRMRWIVLSYDSISLGYSNASGVQWWLVR